MLSTVEHSLNWAVVAMRCDGWHVQHSCRAFETGLTLEVIGMFAATAAIARSPNISITSRFSPT